ncbi:MAG: tetratricopeptide repeat protein [Candidatus Gastranaerophilales bacterium]|nr:tetratricopeptide repeat protein [Candidatus Gastranaerophilales bacterium]
MRKSAILIIICFLLIPVRTDALFQKKDYKQIFLNNAINAEKRNDHKTAFNMYEKALYYYKKDTKIIKHYAEFCERKKYFDKAEKLYHKLYVLTKDNNFLFKGNLCAVKNGKLSNEELQKIIQNKYLTSAQKSELNSALAYHFSYKNDWAKVKQTCDKTPKNLIGKDLITTCIVASERAHDKKASMGYCLRYSQLYPNDSEITNKIISLAEELKDYNIEEKFIKKLSALNPDDKGIKYKLAGFYERQKQWKKAVKVYEALMLSGDKSEHVNKSHAYVLAQATGKFAIKPYTPKPLSGFKLAEKNFYDALDAKNYPKSLPYLEKMLREEPKNTKLLKHRVDIAVAQEDYKEAIKFFEKIGKIKPFSTEDEKFLAFLYSKTNNHAKSLEIIENSLRKNPDDKDLLNLALDYSMAGKNWDKALVYNQKLLAINPDSEKSLKIQGDLYSMKKDFANAIKSYEKLVENYPTLKYKLALANLYMANQEFDKAQTVYQPIYEEYPNVPEFVNAYLDTLLAQKKTRQAYWLIKKHHLDNTSKGYMVWADMAITDKDYYTAKSYYQRALNLDPENLVLKNKLANAYRSLDCIDKSSEIFYQVLAKDPENLEARLGLGSLEIDKKNFKKAREIFAYILSKNPDYRPAKIAVAHSYNAGDDKLSALETLDHILQDEETKMMKAQVYYDVNMRDEAKETIKELVSKDAQDLRYKIKRDNAITLIPTYSAMYQKLADEFNLSYQKYGANISKNIKGNANVFMEYNVIWYMSGPTNFLYDVVNEFRTGVQGRPSREWEYRADAGVKSYQHDGAMLNTDSWLKYYFNDKFNLKLGYKRNNIEQSYLSAVGQYIDGNFTGRSAYNKLYLECEGKLPKQFYYFGNVGYGLITSANLISNQYFEGWAGLGRLLYNNPKNKWINRFGLEAISYNSAYQYNQLKIYNSIGTLFGGYFSPSYFSANTLHAKLEGEIKKIRFKYGIKAFGGIQTALGPDQTTPTWGYSPYVSWDINDHIAITGSYNHYNFADIQRDIFLFGFVLRGFRK